MNIKLVGIDLAKNVFQLCAMNQAGKVVFNRPVKRSRLLEEMTQLSPTVLAMEGCSSAHHWGRVFQAMGHEVRLISAQHVKPFVRGGKTDRHDAVAVAEASQRPGIHFIPVKTVPQQDLQLLNRQRRHWNKALSSLWPRRS